MRPWWQRVCRERERAVLGTQWLWCPEGSGDPRRWCAHHAVAEVGELKPELTCVLGLGDPELPGDLEQLWEVCCMCRGQVPGSCGQESRLGHWDLGRLSAQPSGSTVCGQRLSCPVSSFTGASYNSHAAAVQCLHLSCPFAAGQWMLPLTYFWLH